MPEGKKTTIIGGSTPHMFMWMGNQLPDQYKKSLQKECAKLAKQGVTPIFVYSSRSLKNRHSPRAQKFDLSFASEIPGLLCVDFDMLDFGLDDSMKDMLENAYKKAFAKEDIVNLVDLARLLLLYHCDKLHAFIKRKSCTKEQENSDMCKYKGLFYRDLDTYLKGGMQDVESEEGFICCSNRNSLLKNYMPFIDGGNKAEAVDEWLESSLTAVERLEIEYALDDGLEFENAVLGVFEARNDIIEKIFVNMLEGENMAWSAQLEVLYDAYIDSSSGRTRGKIIEEFSSGIHELFAVGNDMSWAEFSRECAEVSRHK